MPSRAVPTMQLAVFHDSLLNRAFPTPDGSHNAAVADRLSAATGERRGGVRAGAGVGVGDGARQAQNACCSACLCRAMRAAAPVDQAFPRQPQAAVGTTRHGLFCTPRLAATLWPHLQVFPSSC